MQFLKKYRVLLAIGLMGVLILLRWYGVFDFITIEYIQHQRSDMEQFVQNQYWQSVFAYIAIYAVTVIAALPLPALMTVFGGFFFGVIPATIYANIGATSGALIFFLIIRYAFGKRVQEKYKAQLIWINQHIDRYGTLYILGIHQIGFIPFTLITLLLGLSHISFAKFVWTTSVGIIPAQFVFSLAGRQFATIHSVVDIFSWHIMMGFGILGIFALIPILVQHYFDFKKR